jgi:two-component sensor histidine kinase
LGALIRAFDWSRTSIGPLSAWPQSLKTATNILLRSPIPMVMLWGEEGFMIYNDAYSVFAGQRHPRLLGSKVLEGWHEVAAFNRHVLDVVLKGGTLSFQNQELILYRNGVPETLWTDLNYGPVLDETGKPAGVLAVVVETTGQVKAERHLRLVINELNHRVKNTLAMMQAIAAQTFRNADDLQQANASFSARIVALAKANDLLTAQKWEGALLRDVVGSAVSTHGGAEGGRFAIEGPPLRLSPKTALSLSIAVHELATNAIKYGALSNDAGLVTVRWSVARSAEGERLHFEWREDGGPPVVQPTRRGFGSRLIERGLAAELGGEVRLAFEPKGLTCVIDAPLSFSAEGEP